MAATAPAKKSRPKFKLDKFRELAIESRNMQVGVDLALDAGKYEPASYPTIADPADVAVVEVADGDVVYVPHPLMLSDEQQNRFEAFQKGDDLDQEEYTDSAGNKKLRPLSPATIDGRPAPSDSYRMAAAILGETELWRLLAGGGHSNDVALAWQYLTADQAAELAGPKAPTPQR
jgi:hypothetical protein